MLRRPLLFFFARRRSDAERQRSEGAQRGETLLSCGMFWTQMQDSLAAALV
jgi:hypothetical protein